MKKRLIAHIGTHKTGSTSIQKVLYESRSQLRKAGVLFPSTDRGPRPSKHHSVSTAAKSRDPAVADAEYKALMDEFEASGASTMIVSAEGLSAPHTGVPDFFKRFSADFDIEVICYLRRQDLFVESLYNQVLRDPGAGERRTIGAFWRDARISSRLNYHQTLCTWRDIPSRVTALDFSREVKQHGLVNSFLRAAQLEGLDTRPEKVANKSPDMNLVLMLRELHIQEVEHHHKRLIRAAKSLEEAPNYRFLKYTLGSIDRALLLQEFAGVNADLKRDFGIDFSTDMPAEGHEQIVKPEPSYVLSLIAAMSMKKDKQAEAEETEELDAEARELAQAEKDKLKAIRLERRVVKSDRRIEKNAQRAVKADRKGAKAERQNARAVKAVAEHATAANDAAAPVGVPDEPAMDSAAAVPGSGTHGNPAD
jgi:hypothetical protein